MPKREPVKSFTVKIRKSLILRIKSSAAICGMKIPDYVDMVLDRSIAPRKIFTSRDGK